MPTPIRIVTALLACLVSTSLFAAKPTIAVLDFVTDKNSITYGFGFVVVERVEDNTKFLSSDLMTYLVKSNKFDVVERGRMEDLLKEQDFSESGYISPKSAVKMGKLIGADYFVMGKIEQLKAVLETKKAPYADTPRPQYDGKMIVNVRIVDSRGGKIVSAAKVQVAHKDLNYNDKVRPDDFLQALKDKTVKQIVNEVISGVFPVKIVKITDGEVYLNRGAGSILEVGSNMTVYSQGESLVDPDTGESLGSAEQAVAELEVTSIQDKFSKAKILSGDKSVKPGMLVRLSAKIEKEAEATPGSSDKPLTW